MPILGIQNTYIKKRKKKENTNQYKIQKIQKYSLYLLPPRLKIAFLPSCLAFTWLFPCLYKKYQDK